MEGCQKKVGQVSSSQPEVIRTQGSCTTIEVLFGPFPSGSASDFSRSGSSFNYPAPLVSTSWLDSLFLISGSDFWLSSWLLLPLALGSDTLCSVWQLDLLKLSICPSILALAPWIYPVHPGLFLSPLLTMLTISSLCFHCKVHSPLCLQSKIFYIILHYFSSFLHNPLLPRP